MTAHRPANIDTYDEARRLDEEAEAIAAERFRSGAADHEEDGAKALARLGIVIPLQRFVPNLDFRCAQSTLLSWRAKIAGGQGHAGLKAKLSSRPSHQGTATLRSS